MIKIQIENSINISTFQRGQQMKEDEWHTNAVLLKEEWHTNALLLNYLGMGMGCIQMQCY